MEDYERTEALKIIKRKLADKLTEENPVDLPEGLIKEQVKFMSEQTKKQQGKITKHEHHDHDHGDGHDHSHDEEVTPEIMKQCQEPAIKALREELILDQLSRDLKMEVTPEELDQELKNMSQLLGGGNLQQMKKEWQKNGVLARLHSRMKRDKTLGSALEKVTLKEEIVDRKDLIADN